jgi:hypothetical protein
MILRQALSKQIAPLEAQIAAGIVTGVIALPDGLPT